MNKQHKIERRLLVIFALAFVCTFLMVLRNYSADEVSCLFLWLVIWVKQFIGSLAYLFTFLHTQEKITKLLIVSPPKIYTNSAKTHL
jgi:hypothetical protein